MEAASGTRAAPDGGIAVRAARPEDLPLLVELLEDAGARWWARGVRQWPSGSQRAQAPWLAGLVERGALLLAHDDAGPVAGAVLTRAVTPEWEGLPGDALVLHKLAVASRAEGRGLGRRLLARAATLTRREGVALLRLDCWDGNEVLRAFYRRAGLRELDAVARAGVKVRRFEHRVAEGPLADPPLPLAEPVPRIPPPPRRTTGPLPPYRYLPGRAPHPLRHPRGHARQARQTDVADLDPARIHRARAFRRGADLFDAAYWWEAHEAWEALWVALGRRGASAEALQGLVHVAAACLKRFLGHGTVAARMAERGLRALGPAPPGLDALDAAALARAVRTYVASDEARPPVIPLTAESALATRAGTSACR